MSPPPKELAADGAEPGTILAERYRLVEVIGRGAVGAVWRAFDRERDQEVALKLVELGDVDVSNSAARVTRFIREARAMARLTSDHVVRVLDAGSESSHRGELAYLVMELLVGEPLRTRLSWDGSLDAATTLRLMEHVARAVGLAHERGVVHRDLKPGNIFLCGGESDFVAKLLDFGLVKSVAAPLDGGEPLTVAGHMLGTPLYMSPEQIRGLAMVDHRADLWAMGVIAFECLVGRRPFMSRRLSELVAEMEGPLPVPSEQADLPAGFDDWFARALARDVQERFQSAASMIESLREVIAPAATRADEPTLGPIDDALHTALMRGGGEERTARRVAQADGQLVGRASSFAAIDEALRSHCRVITLVGSRGVGRGHLARAWAASRAGTLGASVWHTNLGAARDASTMWRALAASTGAVLEGGDPVLAMGRLLTTWGRAIWIVERAEQVREPLAVALTQWASVAPQLLVLVSCHRSLHAVSERAIPVRALATPPIGCERAGLTADPSILLWQTRAAHAGRVVADLELLARAVRAVQGHPLAIHMAASELPAAELVPFCEHLERERPDGLDGVVDVTLEYLLDRMPSHERACLVQCACFRGAFRWDTAEQVIRLRATGPGAPASGDVLGEVARRGWLERGEGRLAMHPSVRRACTRRLNSGRDLGDAGKRAAFDTMIRHTQAHALWGTPGALDRFRRRGSAAEARRRLGDVEDAAAALARGLERNDAVAVLACSLAVAEAETCMGRADDAVRVLLSAGSMPEAAADQRMLASLSRSRALRLAGRATSADAMLERLAPEAARASAGIRFRFGMERAEVLLCEGDAQHAIDWLSEVEPIAADERARADVVWLRARAALQKGDTTALELGLAALGMFRRLGALRREAQALQHLAAARAERGQWDNARRLFEAAVERHRFRGDRYGAALARLAHAWVVVQAWESGVEGPEALEVCRLAVRSCRELGACQSEASALAALGTLLAAVGDRQAPATLEEAERIARTASPRGSLALLDVLAARTRVELRQDRRRAQLAFGALLREVNELDSRAPAIRRRVESLRARLGNEAVEPSSPPAPDHEA